MEIFSDIISLINLLFIKPLLVTVFILLFYRILSSRKDVVTEAVLILKCGVLLYIFLDIIFYSVLLIFPNEEYGFVNRATGPYWWSYLIMMLGHLLIPLLLLVKKLGRNIYFLLFVSFVINIGWMFERFVIIMTSIHRDYEPDSWSGTSIPLYGDWSLLLIGVIEAVLVLTLAYFLTLKSKQEEISTN